MTIDDKIRDENCRKDDIDREEAKISASHLQKVINILQVEKYYLLIKDK